ncbi:MAG: polysaccharide pyruvyl transferase family protein, partial [Rickettsiales bacterium]|nr:polysaccharide pyruvyl transferase family protein [Rickettsiales bacterium]
LPRMHDRYYIPACVLGRPVMAWAHGIVLHTEMGTVLGTLALNLPNVITVRDQGSYARVKRLPVLRPVFQTADPAILLEASPKETGDAILRDMGMGDKPVIAIAPTYWHMYHEPEDWLPYPMGRRTFERSKKRQLMVKNYNAGLARLCDALAERYGADILLLPRYPGNEWNDLRYMHDIRAQCTQQASIHIFTADSYAPKDYYALWHSFNLLVGVALHDAIFATAFERPCVHLYYESKGKDFFEALQSGERLLHWRALLEEGGTERILEVVEHTLAHWEDIRARTAPHRERLRSEARKNLDHLEALVNNARAWQNH